MLGNHQYIRSFGSIELVKAIAKFHEKSYHPFKIDPLTDIVTSNGGS
jgi:aspartate/methionine/tyrosine aminotransferase